MSDRSHHIERAWVEATKKLHVALIAKDAEIERLKADRDTWEAICHTVDKKLQRAKAEIEELRSYLDEEREKNEKQVRMTMDAHAEIERLETRLEMYDTDGTRVPEGYDGIACRDETIKRLEADDE
jgi:chromosome segregation ATPase